MQEADLLTQALDLVDRAQDDPATSRVVALDLLEQPLDAETRVVAEWAVGVATREQGDLDEARRFLEQAIDRATAAGMSERAAQVRDSLVFTLALQGDNAAALEQADLAAPHLSGAAASRLEMQRGLVLQRLGRADESLEAYRRALPGLQRAADRNAEVRLRVNRSVLHTYRLSLRAAEADLEAALEIASELGNTMQIGACAHNLGFVRGRAGDVPGALASFDEAADAYRAAGVEAGLAAVLEVDRAELLLAAGIAAEAFETAVHAIGLLEEGGNAADLAEAKLLAARAGLADNRIGAAAELAAAASRSFLQQGRTGWHAMAGYVALQARFEPLGRAGSASARTAQRLADEAISVAAGLEQNEWRVESLHATVIAARCALIAGDRQRARRLLGSSDAALRKGPVALRARAWHATALMRLVDGDLRGARRAISAGLKVLDDYRATLGATELRASAGSHTVDLTNLGVTVAIDHSNARELLRWADRARAGALRLPAVFPPDDTGLAAELAQLRSLAQQTAEASLAGRPTAPLRSRQAAVEASVRRRTRTRLGSGATSAQLDPAMLRRTLGERTLVEYVQHAGRVHAVVVDGTGYRHVELGPADPLPGLIERARFDLHRLAHGLGSPMALETAAASLDDVGSELDARLVPMIDAASSDSVVLVPTGTLHGVPWRALPSLTSARFVVAPSARQWLDAATRTRSHERPTLFVAGPDLPAGRAEVEALSARYRPATRLTGRNATTGRVLEALAGSDVAHVAAHGRFRSDNPMFSSLLMADGPLTVYDMERLTSPPHTLVLPACDAAVAGVRAGDELLGLSAALLGLGVRTLVVPQVPIPDWATKDLMTRMYSFMAGGLRPDEALAAAVTSTPDDDAQLAAVRRSFIVLGS